MRRIGSACVLKGVCVTWPPPTRHQQQCVQPSLPPPGPQRTAVDVHKVDVVAQLFIKQLRHLSHLVSVATTHLTATAAAAGSRAAHSVSFRGAVRCMQRMYAGKSL